MTTDELAEEDALTRKLSAELDAIEPLFADAMTTAGKLLAIQKRKGTMTTSPTPPAGAPTQPTPVSPPLQPAPAPENPQYLLHSPFYGVTAQGGPFPNYHRPGEVIETVHPPNRHMEPMNEAAKARLRSLPPSQRWGG